MNKETLSKLIIDFTKGLIDFTNGFIGWLIISNIAFLIPTIAVLFMPTFASTRVGSSNVFMLVFFMNTTLIWVSTFITIAVFTIRKRTWRSIGIATAIIASLTIGTFLMKVSGFCIKHEKGEHYR